MRVHVVSDVHGRSDALAVAGDGADALICLGDLVLFIDYDDVNRGIFAELFGAEAATHLISLRSQRRYEDARTFSRGLWAEVDDRQAVIEGAVRRQYAELFSVMPTPAYVTYGNVDVPALWPDYARDGIEVLDGQTVEIGGRTFGFVGGGLQTPMRTPYEITDEEYAAKVAAIGACGLWIVTSIELTRGNAASTASATRPAAASISIPSGWSLT